MSRCTHAGVIAPFRKQVLTLRQLLRGRGLGAIRVGSVDDFQVCVLACVYV